MAGQLSPWPLVQRGAEGHPVRTLQYLLRARGHTVAVDGIFGPATDARRSGVPAGEAPGRRRHRGPEHVVGARSSRCSREATATPSEAFRRSSSSATSPATQQGSRRRRNLRPQDRCGCARLPAGPPHGHPVRDGGRHRRPRHLAGARQRDAVLLITICPHYLPTGVPRIGTATDSGMVVPRQSPKCDPDPHGAVLVTIHGRVWPGTRGRSWSEEHQDWRYTRGDLGGHDRGVIVSPRPNRSSLVVAAGGARVLSTDVALRLESRSPVGS